MSILWSPYKAVGYVTDGKPFLINQLGTETFLTTTIGNAFQVYKFNKLQVCLVSRSTANGDNITCFQVNGQDTFVGIGNKITVFHRASPVRTYDFHEAAIVGMYQIGKYLITYDVSNVVTMIDTQKRVLISQLELLTSGEDVTITSFVHPSTYINKFLIGFSDGSLELWNFSSQKIIHKFKSHLQYLRTRFEAALEEIEEEYDMEGLLSEAKISRVKPKFTCRITCIEQSPACDVVAVGFSSGDILLMHLKMDAVLFSFKQDSTVTSLSFRTDAPASKYPSMASGCADGRVHIWCLGSGDPNPNGDESDDDVAGAGHGSSSSSAGMDSDECVRKLHCTIEDGHSAAISRVHYMPGEPLLVTSSADNSIKVWVFDSPDGTARLLRSREGHYGYPSRIRYYGGLTNVSMRDNTEGTSCEILSCGAGGPSGDASFRVFNTAIESQNREVSQKPMLKQLGMQRRNEKLPPMVSFDMCETRQRDWSNVVSIHQNHSAAYLWKYSHRVISTVVLKQADWNPRNDSQVFSSSGNGANRVSAKTTGTHATACCLSACGNFALVGTKSGMIYKYNVQSGLTRGSFPATDAAVSGNVRTTVAQIRLRTPGNVLHDKHMMSKEEVLTTADGKGVPKKGSAGSSNNDFGSAYKLPQHSAAVTGIFIDMASMIMVSIGLDGLIIFWDFNTHTPLHCIESPGTEAGTPCPNVRLQGFRDGGLVAVASQDRVVRLYDMTTFQLCRRFEGHTREITDICFTPDGRRCLISSLDNTVRVWDVPTGRCLSWMLFDSPVLSLTVSLSGEYLCVAQLDKEGIFMYVDRSLYETVHFWCEPAVPTPVESCLVKVDHGDEQQSTPLMEGESEGVEGAGSVIAPVQAQVDTCAGDDAEALALSKEQAEADATQRGIGSITLSTVPRAYWTTLFYLESIKSRNKPTEAPKAAPNAPFFLPTLNRQGGAAPSFPTPAEYAALLAKQPATVSATTTSDAAAVASKDTAGSVGVKEMSTTISKSKRHRGDAGADTEKVSSPSVAETDAQIMQQLSAMGSVWADDGVGDEEDEKGETNDQEEEGAGDYNSQVWGIDVTPTTAVAVTTKSSYQSRLISKKTVLPRCKLVMHVLQELPWADSVYSQDIQVDASSPILDYLAGIPPSAIDAEFRALCLNEEDTEGQELLLRMLRFFTHNMQSGTHFELLQAYLHRFVLIYTDYILASPVLATELARLRRVHAVYTEKFRHILQSNLCLLKILAKIPTI